MAIDLKQTAIGPDFFVPSLSALVRFGDLGESPGTREGAPA